VKIYIVSAFSAEPYNENYPWVDSVYDSLEAAQAYVNKYRNESGFAVEIKEDEEDSYGYMLSSYIEVRELNKSEKE
jgi:hypothetical protein